MIADIEQVPPCRVLFRDGKPVDETLTARPRVNLEYSITDTRPAPGHEFRQRVGRPRVDRTGKGYNSLPPQMRTVARLAAQGLTAREIADRTNYTTGSVRVTLFTKIYPALGVKNLAGLVELLKGEGRLWATEIKG